MEIDRISELIKKLRKEKDLTQEELGNLLGVSGKAVSKWERGQSLPDVAIIKKLSDNLGISTDELLQGKMKEKEKESTKKSSKYLLLLLIPLFLIITVILAFNMKKENTKLQENQNIELKEDNNNSKEIEDTPCTLIRTFYIDDIRNSNDENYLYITLHEYQVEGVFTIKMSKVIGKDLEENNNYEFTFKTTKDYTWCSADILFNKWQIVSIQKTDKVGMEQTSIYYC